MADNRNMQPVQVIAKIFGVSTRRVEQLKAEGIIEGEGKPTKYDLLPTIQRYIRYLSDKAAGREKKEKMAALEEEKLQAEVNMKKSKAEVAALDLAEFQGKLHKAEDVEAITTDHVLFLRSMLMAMPGKMAVDLAACRTAAEAAERVRSEVYFVLEKLSTYRYDPEEYKKRVRERRGWDEGNDGQDG